MISEEESKGASEMQVVPNDRQASINAKRSPREDGLSDDDMPEEVRSIVQADGITYKNECIISQDDGSLRCKHDGPETRSIENPACIVNS